MGGLEPPTSASQTRRAGRLRYTPADKSIIRTMDKRQDTPLLIFIAALLTLVPFFLLGLTACQTNRSTPLVEPELPVSSPTEDAPAETLPAPNTPMLPEPILTPTADCLQQGGQLNSGHIYSEYLQTDLNYQVYLPPCYDTDTDLRYPVTYLLHGLTFNEDQWIRLGLAEQMDRLIAQGNVAPFIIVLPGEARFQQPYTSPFPDALVQELIPWVDQHYRTRPERSYRAIGGLSRGAAWAVHTGFVHYEHFSNVGAHSLPLFAADNGNLNTWLTEIPAADLPAFFIDIGRGDPERISAQAFADLLDEYQIPHTWYLFNGNHTEAYWSAHLESYLRWYARNW